MELDRSSAVLPWTKQDRSVPEMEASLLDSSAELRPPAPEPRATTLGPLGLLRVLASNPLEAWTAAHFEEPIVSGGLWTGRVVVLSDPAAIRRVLVENSANYQKDWFQRRVLSAGLTGGLLTAESREWRVQRRALAPLFTRNIVTSFAPAMLAAASVLVERVSQYEGETVDIAVEVTRAALDVLQRTIFSGGLGGDREDIRVAMKAYFETIGRLDPLDVLGLPESVPRPARWKMRQSIRLLERAIDKIILTRHRRLAEDPGGVPDDILTLLLKAADPRTGEGLSETEIRANILTFIAAGHETTANCIAWSLYLLSQSRQWRARVQAEVDREFTGDIATLADRLVETRAVVDEANRLYPPIAAISRVAIGPDELAGRSVKAGTMIVIAPYVLHRHRNLWVKPDYFDPGRFLGGTRATIDRFAYLPFGAGARVCIGSAFALQEVSIVLAALMSRFTFEVAPGHSVWPIMKITLRPQGGLPVIVRHRAR